MINEKKEQIGIILNLVGNSNISTDLRIYCEEELKAFLKELSTCSKCKESECICKTDTEIDK